MTRSAPIDSRRRAVLRGLGLAAVAPLAGRAAQGAVPAPDAPAAPVPAAPVPAAPAPAAPAPDASVTAAPRACAVQAGERISPFGAHQAGITTPRPAHGLLASFAVIAQSPADLEDLLRRLSARIVFLAAGGPVPVLDPRFPPADSGLLGPVIEPDALTITVALGDQLFQRHDWLRPHRPARLERMAAFPNDALSASLCHGDLSLQICANSSDACVHALRDVVKTLSDRLVLGWMQAGSVPQVTATEPGRPPNARNFLGFRDGSANPDAADQALMDRIVWAGAGEPDWAQGGSYQAVRIIRNFVERWDRTPLAEQERVFGRAKITGAPLDHPGGTEFDTPDYAADPEGRHTPLRAHIRLANPRGPGADAHLMLRRPFNYTNGVTRNGQIDQGLLFICYQADLQQGFIHVQNALNGEPMEEYVKPVGGGYFFALPGMADGDDYLGRKLIASLSRP